MNKKNEMMLIAVIALVPIMARVKVNMITQLFLNVFEFL